MNGDESQTTKVSEKKETKQNFRPQNVKMPRKQNKKKPLNAFP